MPIQHAITPADKFVQHAIMSLSASPDPDDAALAILLDVAINDYRNGRAQALLHMLRLVKNRETVVTHQQLMPSRN